MAGYVCVFYLHLSFMFPLQENKLCDLGSCAIGPVSISDRKQRADEEEIVQKQTTQMYRAPEMCDLYMQPELTEAVDIWALGCLLYFMAFWKHPFEEAGNLGTISGKYKVPQDCKYSADFTHTIMRMLQVRGRWRILVMILWQQAE